MSKTMLLKVIGGIFLALSISGIIAVSLVYKLTGGKIPFEYGIILDAGSTKTQVTLYKWEGQKDHGTGIVSQVDTCKAKPGLDKERDVLHAGKTILPCLSKVSPSIPKEQQARTPLYLAATAGMRMLRKTDKYLADAIILGVKVTLLENSNYSIKDVGIMSGKDEGIFGWVTGNFLRDKLHVEDPTATFGSLDMGGASTQIAFELPPRENATMDNDTTVNMQLYGQDHLLFAQSYLCFGINEAMRRHRAILAKDKSEGEMISDPCGFPGDAVNYTYSYLYDHFCTRSLAPGEIKDSVYTFTGSGKNEDCSAAVAKLIDLEDCLKFFDVCFTKPKEKLQNVKYMAVSTFYYVASALNVTKSTLKEYRESFHNYCKLSKAEAEQKLNPDVVEYARDYCLEAHYVHHILTKEYDFNETTWENIEFILQVGDSDLGWSLGYMINATNAVPKGKPSMPLISKSTFAVLLVVFSLLAIAAILILLFSPHSSQSTITVLP